MPTRNLLLNPSFEVDSDGDGLADSWILYHNVAGTLVTSLPAGLYGSRAQQVSYVGLAGDVATAAGIRQTVTPAAAGETFSFSLSAKGSNVGCLARVYLTGLTSGGSDITGVYSDPFSLADSWVRRSLSFTAPVNTGKVRGWIRIYDIHAGDTFTLTIDGAKLERSGAATPFIPPLGNPIPARLLAALMDPA